MSVFVTDTHPLVWFGGGRHGNLSQVALKVFADADAGQAFIYIPAVVLWEIALLERNGKVKLDGGFSRWTEKILAHPGFGLAPLEPAVIARAVAYNFNSDPFDSVIAATAAELSLPLITKDAAMTDSSLIEIHW
jgi:PIN domain nuclease of toxin-antitoxin system